MNGRESAATPGVVGRLQGRVREQPWGSYTAIAGIQRRPAPTAQPEGELWFGDHPRAPSLLERDGRERPLDEVIAADPAHELGGGPLPLGERLPFLVKILAAIRPLSIQVHPNAAQARAGHDAEEAAGIPLDAAERSYPDPWPKPELLLALEPVDALCGFRPIDATLHLADLLALDGLDALVRPLRDGGAGAIGGVVAEAFALDEDRRLALVAALGERAADVAAGGGPLAADAAEVAGLARAHPGDAGVVVASLLRLVHLEPGESLHVPAGVPHAYLRGTGVEVMAASDNVLRGGLTPKHVDVGGLLAILDTRADAATMVGVRATDAGEVVHDTPAPHFRLSHLDVGGTVAAGGQAAELDRRGVEVLLCAAGEVTVGSDGDEVTLASGEAAFVSAAATRVTVNGEGQLYRTTAGNPVAAA